MSTMFCTKEKQICHRKQRVTLNAFENSYSNEKGLQLLTNLFLFDFFHFLRS